MKHEFFFRGFFRNRSYDSLNDLPVETYRRGEIFKNLQQNRFWISAESLFTKGLNGDEVLSPEGRLQIDDAIAKIPTLYGNPLVVEGYRSSNSHAEEMLRARERAALVRGYLQMRFHLLQKTQELSASVANHLQTKGKLAGMAYAS